MTHSAQAPAIDFESLTLKDALDLAVLIEEEARDRYEELAAQLLLHHTPGASKFFTKMVRVEELHRGALLAQREKAFKGQPVEVRREMIFDVEAPDYDEVRTGMTERAALLTALKSEEKAHDFFATALKYVKHPEVKKLFQELCHEELEHQQLVKQELDRLPPAVAFEGIDVSDEPNSQ